MLRNVPNPRQCLIATLLDDLKVAHLNSGNGEVGNLKLDRDRCTFLYLISYDIGQTVSIVD